MDIVLQGSADAYTIEIAEYYLNVQFINNIIISCWENDCIETINHRIIILKNKDVDNPGSGNRNRQIKSSLEGLKLVKTEFSAKLRSDQKISSDSLLLMYNFYEKNKDRELHFYDNISKPKNKICVAGIFRPFPLHPRDHIFWGNTADLIDIFTIPYCNSKPGHHNYNITVRSEAYIASHYYSNYEPKIKDFIKNPNLYLVDNAPFIKNAFLISDKIITKIFKPFPKIDLQWPKYNLSSYYYDFTEKNFGEYWSDDA